MDNKRIIQTPFFSNKAFEVLKSVIGQWSDGLYENSPRFNRYWQFADVKTNADGRVVIEVDEKSGEYSHFDRKWLTNGFFGMSDVAVIEFFGTYVKRIMQAELKDNKIQNGWKRDNKDFQTEYLNYHVEICVAEVYCIYEALIGRISANSKYDKSIVEAVYGQQKSEEETKVEEEKRAYIAELEAQWTEELKLLEDYKKQEIDEIEKKFNEKRNEINARWKKFLEKAA